jgi:hypothetical protein
MDAMLYLVSGLFITMSRYNQEKTPLLPSAPQDQTMFPRGGLLFMIIIFVRILRIESNSSDSVPRYGTSGPQQRSGEMEDQGLSVPMEIDLSESEVDVQVRSGNYLLPFIITTSVVLGPTVPCRVCDSEISIEGKNNSHVVRCTECNEVTPIRAAPPGKKYVRLVHGLVFLLFILDFIY